MKVSRLPSPFFPCNPNTSEKNSMFKITFLLQWKEITKSRCEINDVEGPVLLINVENSAALTVSMERIPVLEANQGMNGNLL